MPGPNRFWLFAWLFPVALTLLSVPLSLPFAPWRGLSGLHQGLLPEAAALLHGTLNAVAGLSLLLVERTHDLLVGAVGLPGLFLLALFNLGLRRRV